MQNVESPSARPFALPEYWRAQLEVLFSAVKALKRAKNPLYASIPEGDSHEMLPATQNTMPSGHTVRTEPLRIDTKIIFKWDDIRNCNLDAFAEQADKTADEQLAMIIPHVFTVMRRTSEAADTATDAGGAPFSFELFLTAFSKIALQFRRDGEPIMPQLVVHPDMAKEFDMLPPLTKEQQDRWDAVIEGKRKEYFANRRYRRLP
jgi:hypothetical protein